MATIIDGTQMYHDAIRRISELERLNSALATEIDRQRLVVQAAQAWNITEYGSDEEAVQAMRLSEIVNIYEASREG
jgi:hypothetical protein